MTTLVDVYNAMLAKEGEREDNKKMFKELYSRRFMDADLFTVYIDFILQNTREWYADAPESYRSETSVARLKSVINNLLNETKYPSIACLVDEDKRQEVRKAMRVTLKKLVEEGNLRPKKSRAVSLVEGVSVEDSTSDADCERHGGEEGSEDAQSECKERKRGEQSGYADENLELLLMLVEHATIDDTWRPFIKALVTRKM